MEELGGGGFGTIRRRIKKFNILIDNKANFYLTGFGIARDPDHEDSVSPRATPFVARERQLVRLEFVLGRAL